MNQTTHPSEFLLKKIAKLSKRRSPSNSWRVRSIEDTLESAIPVLDAAGITRVSDITALDRIGLPTHVSVRPDASIGSLCVNAGKGVSAQESLASAIMEGIEFHFADQKNSRVVTRRQPFDVFCDELPEGFSFSLFCPDVQAKVCPDVQAKATKNQEVSLLDAFHFETGQRLSVPAELVFHPLTELGSSSFFGTSTNGLCSGNSFSEAVLHGTFEVMERDTQSFLSFRPSVDAINEDALPDYIKDLLGAVRAAGFDVYLLYSPGDWGVHYVQAYIVAESTDPFRATFGSGAHVDPSIAVSRAVTEAAQSRLVHIHGGRDDLVDRHDFFTEKGSDYEKERVTDLLARLRNANSCIDFTSLSQPPLADIENTLSLLNKRIVETGLPGIFCVKLYESENIHVVRVLIPGMEAYSPRQRRIGPRLLSFIKELPQW
ncbi:YcaO-like family protein [uncultured Hoeflea sp.]|uniref:YcaO-like family protein n=1 Tax=uncultured Hoeflea sp. TaxID=538666 RepID=UPI00261E5919|nr:YcaO-like family protein [uncultured Hoeflea sp.]